MVGTLPAHDPLREERVERVRLGICETTFKAAYGVTPGDYRRRCVGPDRSPG